MKIKLLVTMMTLAAAVQFAPVICAQDQKEHDQGGRHHRNGPFANLPADEKQKLQAAHQKAMQDPGVKASHEKMQQARKEFRDAMHAAMLKADPSIQPILDKMPKGPERDED